MTTERRPSHEVATSAYKLWIIAALLATYAAVVAVAYGRLDRPAASEEPALADAPSSTARAPTGSETTSATRSAPPAPRPVAKAKARAPRVRTRSS